ncbi:MAG: hypothetical protein ACYTGL_12470 [Planctomycetota bacterium]|jgi:chromosome segregation ATPase
MSTTKKAFAGAAGLALVIGLLFGSNAIPFLRTAGDDVRQAANEAIPEEFKLRTARNMLDDKLEPQIREMKHVVAEAQIEVERLTAKLDKRASQLADLRTDLAERHDQYQSGDASVKIDNVSFSRDEIKSDMEQLFQEVKLNESTLESEQEVLAAKKSALKSNEEKIAELLAAREKLELQIQELEARVSAVEAKETIVKSEFDDSALNDIQNLLDSVEKKVDVREREMSLEGQSTHRIPRASDKPADSVDEISAYLGRSDKNADVADAE